MSHRFEPDLQAAQRTECGAMKKKKKKLRKRDKKWSKDDNEGGEDKYGEKQRRPAGSFIVSRS